MKQMLIPVLLVLAAAAPARAQEAALAAEAISLFSTLCLDTYPDERMLERLVRERQGVQMENDAFLKELSIPDKAGRGWRIRGESGDYALLVSEGMEAALRTPGSRRRNRECSIVTYAPQTVDLLTPLKALVEPYARRGKLTFDEPIELGPPILRGVSASWTLTAENAAPSSVEEAFSFLHLISYRKYYQAETDPQARFSLQFKPPEAR